ncbi:MAG: TonB family protein [Rhodothermales bacterium]
MAAKHSSTVTRNDAYAFGISFVLHAALLVVLSLTTVAAQKQVPIGYIEVDFGPLSEGRPVQQTQKVDNPIDDLEPEPVVQEQQEEIASAPEVARPVELPDEQPVDDPDVVQKSADTEVISPQQQTSSEDTKEPEPEPRQETRVRQGAGTTGGDTGSDAGDDGAGSEKEAAAPFQIEGLNRTPVTAPPPAYSEKVNATIRVRITVDPQGRVVRQIPLLKGNPALEQSVLETLRDWRFNPLPPNAPQENQVGIVTFRFRLE